MKPVFAIAHVVALCAIPGAVNSGPAKAADQPAKDIVDTAVSAGQFKTATNDLDVIRAWWSLRSLLASRWLIEHGFDPSSPGCEFDVLRSRM